MRSIRREGVPVLLRVHGYGEFAFAARRVAGPLQKRGPGERLQHPCAALPFQVQGSKGRNRVLRELQCNEDGWGGVR